MLRLTSNPADKDQWWTFTDSAVKEVSCLLMERVYNLFDQFRLEGLADEFSPSDVEAGNLGVLNALTKVNACLLLARVHDRLGNTANCIQFATNGLNVAGMAVGPKKALKELLKRHNQRF